MTKYEYHETPSGTVRIPKGMSVWDYNKKQNLLTEIRTQRELLLNAVSKRKRLSSYIACKRRLMLTLTKRLATYTKE